MTDIITASSLVFTIIALTFNSQIAEIKVILEERNYDKGSPQSRKHQRGKALKAIIVKAFPLFLAFWILFYTLLPDTINLILNSRLSLWHFNAVNTLFVFIELIILLFAIRAFYMLFRLLIKVKSLQ
ncbi:MAG: hypothetical protein IH950_04230 [Bacteroidetes bacterium]|nr:hypothetical protein [Bacteroidota bacterium]